MIVYRDATESDLNALCALGGEVSQLHHAVRPDVYAAPGDPARDAAQYARHLGHEHTRVILAEADGMPVGYVIARWRDETNTMFQSRRMGEVISIGVTEVRRGQGIGRALIQLAESWAIDAGARDLSLNVWAFNERALKLYRELGYEVRAHYMGKRVAPDGSTTRG